MKLSAQLNVEPRSLKFAAEACGGEIRGGSPATAFTRVCTDTRAVQPGDLFIALQGERFDAHDFLPDAAIRGAAALVLGFPRAAACPAGVPAVVVEDTRAALGRIAARYRRDFDIPVIAVAGSNGKTTTKEILGTVLARKFPTLRSEASFNNDIGVPLTLLKLDASHLAAVLEVGSNHPGELAPLLDIIQPRYGVLTSIGREHLEFFGDLDGVAREEGALAEALPADGKLFVNGDTPKLDAILPRARAAVVRVGTGEANDWRVSDITLTAEGTRFTVNGPSAAVNGAYRVGLLGRHQAVNAALAVAVATELGLSRAEIAAGLAEAKPAKMRLQIVAARGFQILDDSYNANADSMIAALETLRDLPCTARRVAVLGVMAELGKQSESAHAEIGRATFRCGVGRLFALGAHAETMAAAARAAGLADVEVFADADAALPAIRAAVQPGDVVLVKASRSARLERVVEALAAA